jgi:hypothetical protein
MRVGVGLAWRLGGVAWPQRPGRGAYGSHTTGAETGEGDADKQAPAQ